MRDPEKLVDIVPEYHSRNPLVRALFRRRLEIALRLGALDGSERLEVLDLGCGEGAFLFDAQKRFPRHAYTGWDVHPGLDALRAPGLEFARVDISKPAGIPARAFDRVFCLDVLEHFERLDGVLASIKGLLRPGGLLVLSEPTESPLYRLGRLAVKGTLSSQEGPAAGPHYHDARGVHREVLKAGFDCAELRKIPFAPFDLFHLTSYRPS